ncbi:hypothetical protein QTG54_014331 [Skeletonema marinoi]|uniref:Uncharacterized protein n=1 Tax=Skeletonema marinoi TaxID=267567 RepID=A0AAD8XVZ3_9STRA|nr:hypothetical protein QTG54_014331 [Skeletonema marinoi]
MPAGAKMRDAVASKEVLILIQRMDQSLCRSSPFLPCPLDSVEVENVVVVGPTKVISFHNGRASEHKHSITGEKTNKGVTVTPKDIRQIFSASKNDRPEEVEENNGENVSHYEVMSFSEFVEAIARLGVMKMLRRAQEL